LIALLIFKGLDQVGNPRMRNLRKRAKYCISFGILKFNNRTNCGCEKVIYLRCGG